MHCALLSARRCLAHIYDRCVRDADSLSRAFTHAPCVLEKQTYISTLYYLRTARFVRIARARDMRERCELCVYIYMMIVLYLVLVVLAWNYAVVVYMVICAPRLLRYMRPRRIRSAPPLSAVCGVGAFVAEKVSAAFELTYRRVRAFWRLEIYMYIHQWIEIKDTWRILICITSKTDPLITGSARDID